jgi:AcrR family transcriptional regulator
VYTHNMVRAVRSQYSTAEARRDTVIDAAIIEFAEKGLHGTATEDIARRAGISQPYIFRLFGTKKDLFMAAARRVCDRIGTIFEHAAAEDGEGTVLERMGLAFSTLLADRVELLMLLQSFAGTADLDVQEMMKTRLTEIFAQVKRLSGEDDDAVEEFMAHGMLLIVLSASNLPDVLGLTNWGDFAQYCQLRSARKK